MNRKVNTVVFILAATIFNIFMMLVLLTVGLAAVSMITQGNQVSDAVANLVMIVLVIFSIAGAFFIYHRLVRLLSSKIDMDAYFHPIFGASKKPRK